MLTPDDIQWAAQLAVLAVTFSDLLTGPKMIFERYGVWVERLETKNSKLAHVLGYCGKCTAGQLALWIFPLIADAGILFVVPRWICFVSLTIFQAAIFSLALSRLRR